MRKQRIKRVGPYDAPDSERRSNPASHPVSCAVLQRVQLLKSVILEAARWQARNSPAIFPWWTTVVTCLCFNL